MIQDIGLYALLTVAAVTVLLIIVDITPYVLNDIYHWFSIGFRMPKLVADVEAPLGDEDKYPILEVKKSRAWNANEEFKLVFKDWYIWLVYDLERYEYRVTVREPGETSIKYKVRDLNALPEEYVELLKVGFAAYMDKVIPATANAETIRMMQRDKAAMALKQKARDELTYIKHPWARPSEPALIETEEDVPPLPVAEEITPKTENRPRRKSAKKKAKKKVKKKTKKKARNN